MTTPARNPKNSHSKAPQASDAASRSREPAERNPVRRSFQPVQPATPTEPKHERKTPFWIIVALSEARGREIIDFFGEPGDDLMAAALSLEDRGIKCRRILLLLDDHELRTLAAGWLPLTTRLSGLTRQQLIDLLTQSCGE